MVNIYYGKTQNEVTLIIDSYTVQESRSDLQKLHTAVDDLHKDMMISRTIDRRLESAYGYHTGTFHGLEDDETSTIVPSDDAVSLRSRRSFVLPHYHSILRSTKVYLRTRRAPSIDSFCPEKNRTDTASTMLSNISLGDVSNLSFYALPLHHKEAPSLCLAASYYPRESPPVYTILNDCYSAVHKANINRARRRIQRLNAAVKNRTQLEAWKFQLVYASLRTRNTEFIRELLLETKVDVNTVSAPLDTLLFSAVEFEDTTTVQMLLSDFNADPRIIGPREPEKTAVHRAIQRGDMVSLRLMLNHDRELIPFFNKTNMNLLLFAVRQGQGKPARFLVARGYSPTEIYPCGRTLLHHAAGRDRSRGVRGMIRWLVEDCGIDVNTTSSEGSPLTIALKVEYDDQNEEYEKDAFGEVIKVDRKGRWNHPAIAELLSLGASASAEERVELQKWAQALKLGAYTEGYLVGDLDALVEGRPDIFDEAGGDE